MDLRGVTNQGTIVPHGQSGASSSTALASPASSSGVNAVGIRRLCAQCEKEFDSAKLFKCGACMKVEYCSKECQKLAWKTHEFVCRNSFLIPDDNEVVCKFIDSKNVLGDITQAEFRERMKSTFVCASLFTKEALKKVCQETKSKIEAKRHTISDSVAIKCVSGDLGYGLVALRDIPKDAIICSFGGKAMSQEEWNAEKRSNRSKLCSFRSGNHYFEPDEYMSLGAVINDGLPNAKFKHGLVEVTYSDINKTMLDRVVIALREIKAGETICIDYGMGHTMKSAPYSMEEATLARLIAKYSRKLDFSYLNKPNDSLDYHEISYLLFTPYALMTLHLRSGLDPASTLKSLQRVSSVIKNECEKAIEVSTAILEFLKRIPQSEKQAYATVLEKISQEYLCLLCINSTDSIHTVNECEIFGRVMGRLRTNYVGALTGGFWGTSEEEEFKKKFLSDDHQKGLYQDPELNALSFSLRLYYIAARDRYLGEIKTRMSKKELGQLEAFMQKYSVYHFTS